MIRDHSVTQLSLSEFDWPFQSDLDPQNRWVKLAQCIPWDDFAQSYYAKLNQKRCRPAKPARLVIGALIIKHKLALSDRETVAQIQENPYLQYFVGLKSYQMRAPFVPSLFVDIRKRMGQSVFDQLQEAIIKQLETPHSSATAPRSSDQTPDDSDGASDNTDPSSQNNNSQPLLEQHDDAQPANPEAQTPEAQVPTDASNQAIHHGKLILDATVAPQGIRYPTDLSLLNEARKTTETLIDALYPHTPLKQKPRTYRQQARKAFLGLAKQRRPKPKARTQAIKAQLNYLRRNLGHIEQLLEHFPVGQALPLSNTLLYRYWVIQHLYTQQRKMFQTGEKRCDYRIVSISQPYVRPIVRGKQHTPVEFGAKLSVSLNAQGIACVDQLRWDAFSEGQDLLAQVDAYNIRHGHYPEVVLADPAYGSQHNRRALKAMGIRFGAKPLGRPPKLEPLEHKQQKQQRQADYRQRIPIEGKFGQAKQYYGLNCKSFNLI